MKSVFLLIISIVLLMAVPGCQPGVEQEPHLPPTIVPTTPVSDYVEIPPQPELTPSLPASTTPSPTPSVISTPTPTPEPTPNIAYQVHGLNFGPYTKEGQNPDYGTVIDEEQIRNLLEIIAPYTEWVRTFGCDHGLEKIGRIGHEMGLKVAVGAWLSSDLAANEEQISSLINIAKAGEADMLIVGSEVLLRGDLTEAKLIEYINRVKKAMPGVPVTTAEVYSSFLAPALISAVDVVFVNYYPVWEGITIDQAVFWLDKKHQQLITASKGKKVIISETGWPSGGKEHENVIPSPENASFYFLNFVSWARDNRVDYFYFEAFDEPWKSEDSWGSNWGIWDKDGNMKPGMEDVFNGKTVPDNWSESKIPGGPGNPDIEFTHVPRYDSPENLKGQVWHVEPDKHKVAVFIKVQGLWYTKPYWSKPLTYILPDGSWSCDITTGGVDSLATEIAAFLFPNEYQPPLMKGTNALPAGFYEAAIAQISVTRTPE